MKFNIACTLAHCRGRDSAAGNVTLQKSDGSRFDCRWGQQILSSTRTYRTANPHLLQRLRMSAAISLNPSSA